MKSCIALALIASAALPVCRPAAAQQDSALTRARAILREVPLIDGHNDLPWEMRNRAWSNFDSLDISRSQPAIMTDIARLRAGGVGGQFWSTYSPGDVAEGAQIGMEQGDIVHQMLARYPQVFELAGTADDIVRIHRAGKIASMLGLEGGHMIQSSLGLLRAFYRDGVRYMTLTHNVNTPWADAASDTAEHGGLTRFGEEVVREMNRLGMLVDLSHVSDSTMWDALRVTQAPVIYSHSSSRHFVSHLRNVPDDIARAVGQNRGVIMVTFVPQFIHLPSWEWSQRQDSVTRQIRATITDSAAAAEAIAAWGRANPMPRPGIEVVADHIEHLRDVAGVETVGLGSDFDGISATPIGLEDVSTFPALLAELIRRGWSDGDVKRVAGLNVLRVMREAERVAARLQRERPASAATIHMLDGRPGSER